MSLPRPTPQAPPPTPRHPYTPLPSTPESPPSSSLPLTVPIPPTPALTYTPLPPHTPSPYPSPPSSCSSTHPSPPYPQAQPIASLSYNHSSASSLHPVLSYSQDVPALIWDIRTDPTPGSLQQISRSDDGNTTSILVPVPERELLMPATAPPVPSLCLSCGIVPSSSSWGTIFVTPSSQRNNASAYAVSVLDVLNAVRNCMKTRITQEEWDALPTKQKNRVNEVFHSRWNESNTPAATRGDGVLRQDSLLQHTLWGGLSLSVVEEDAAVLSLRRPSP